MSLWLYFALLLHCKSFILVSDTLVFNNVHLFFGVIKGVLSHHLKTVGI